MRKTHLAAVATLLFLTACTLPRLPARDQINGSPPSIVASDVNVSSMPPEDESEEVGEGAPATEEAAEGGTLQERLLGTGILEIGNASAPLTLLLFTEHHCSYCRQFMTELFPRLKTDFLERGTLKMHVAMLPLQKYPASREAALGLICSAGQGQGLAMHRVLFTNPNKGTAAMLSYATEFKLDTKVLRECLESARAKALLESQESWAQSLGVSVVPSFFLNGQKFVGLPYYPDLRGRIEEALKKIEEQK